MKNYYVNSRLTTVLHLTQTYTIYVISPFVLLMHLCSLHLQLGHSLSRTIFCSSKITTPTPNLPIPRPEYRLVRIQNILNGLRSPTTHITIIVTYCKLRLSKPCTLEFTQQGKWQTFVPSALTHLRLARLNSAQQCHNLTYDPTNG